MSQNEDFKEGDIAQVNPDKDAVFGSCFMLITEVRSWGVIGYVSIPSPHGAGQAFLRKKYEDIERVGRASWIPAQLGE